jgi:hypothetical protein
MISLGARIAADRGPNRAKRSSNGRECFKLVVAGAHVAEFLGGYGQTSTQAG